jgi:hypothetical protein
MPISRKLPDSESTSLDQAPPTPVADVALDDWCQAKSASVGRRIEGLSAFYKRCQREGVGRLTPEQFEAKFKAFMQTAA